MAKVKNGLKKLIEEGRFPESRYTGEIKSVAVRKGWEIAKVAIVEAEDDELLGRTVSFFLLNEDQGNSIGLQQLMTHLHWEEIPEDEEGERDTKTSLVGVRFVFDLSYENGQMRVRPVLEEEDWEWQRDLLGEGEKEEEEESEEEEEEEEEEETEEEEEESEEEEEETPKKRSSPGKKKVTKKVSKKGRK